MGLENDKRLVIDTTKFSKAESSIDRSKSMMQFKCAIEGCNKFFGKKSRLIYHERTHTGERPFNCAYEACDSSYKRKTHLERHIRASHNKTPREEFSCYKCSKQYCSVYSLRKHQKYNCVPVTALLYSCEHCDMNFKKEKQLVKHQYVHTGVRPFQCSFEGCNKDYLLQSKLNEHFKTHSKSYSCSYDNCHEVFNLYSLLRQHLTQHKKKCDFCGDEFARLSQLTRHLDANHSEMREALFCPYTPCERYYFEAKNLKVHIFSKHDKMPKYYECEMCQMSMVTKQSLLRHLKKIHDPQCKKLEKKKIRPRKPRKDKGVSKTDYQRLLSAYWSEDDCESRPTLTNGVGVNDSMSSGSLNVPSTSSNACTREVNMLSDEEMD